MGSVKMKWLTVQNLKILCNLQLISMDDVLCWYFDVFRNVCSLIVLMTEIIIDENKNIKK